MPIIKSANRIFIRTKADQPEIENESRSPYRKKGHSKNEYKPEYCKI